MIYKLLFSATIGGFVLIRARYRRVWTGIERTGVASLRERILTSGIVLSQLLPALLWLGDHLSDADLPPKKWTGTVEVEVEASYAEDAEKLALKKARSEGKVLSAQAAD